MNLIIGIIFTALVALIAVGNSPSVPLKSLCVMSKDGHCWIDKASGLERVPEAGDYVISPADFSRILEKLKASQ